MRSVADKLDLIEHNVMKGLKDFQQATVCRVAELFENGQMRVLVSDEVGLGKTLIARGVIAKLAQIRKKKGDDLVKVVYICSNAAIADQNLNKLMISRQIRKENASYSRLSMQHINIFEQENDQEVLKRYIQLIPLTPDTSLKISKSQGTVNERALMYAVLREIPEFMMYDKSLNKLFEYGAAVAWNNKAKDYYLDKVNLVNSKTEGKYIEDMISELKKELKSTRLEGVSCYDALINSCEAIRINGARHTDFSQLIKKLRFVFAKISLNKLDPDLIIMDEFQRFRYLLNADKDSDTGMLTARFFKSKDVRMLLLSATPYKMYSTLEEIDESNVGDHFEEFLKVMQFLNEANPNAYEQFRTVWDDYSIKLKEMSRGRDTVLSIQKDAADEMYKSVCRTERISEHEMADMIDDSEVKNGIAISDGDIKSYIELEKLLKRIGLSDNIPIDYVKSCPYLLSFMNNYQLKRNLERYFKKHPDEIVKAKGEHLWLNKNQIDGYIKIPCNNARLEHVMQKVMSDSAELLLWIPPSKGYYEAQGVFKNAKHFSKTLIFSSWEMVPRMIASMISYEAERRTIGKLQRGSAKRKAQYFGKNRYPAPRLNFNVSDREAKSLQLFSFIYPSEFLTDCYDPIDCMNRGLSLKSIEKEVSRKIEKRMKDKLSGIKVSEKGRGDSRWYGLMPLILDSEDYAKEWLIKVECGGLDSTISENEIHTVFHKNIEALADCFYDYSDEKMITLGKMPDDLVSVLTNIAIAAPAVCVNRVYKKYEKSNIKYDNYLPSLIAKLFLDRMNTVESTAVIELACGKKTDDTHWQNVLTYCKQGNLQAVFDEYAHMLVSGIDDDENLIDNLHHSLYVSLDIRTTVYNIDTFNAFRSRMNDVHERGYAGMRTHFAVAFTRGDNKEADTNRKTIVRNAFNSPLRPFVLASTSIGQEGLDFHNYCRRIVHWNLPSNPIDLEQREGRINRFECLAIRQNVADRYGKDTFKKDIWVEMFKKASKNEKRDGCSDLIPFWGVNKNDISDEMVKIERIVPMYPFSKDEQVYRRLIKILSLYRLTLGQARQEELLEYIFQNFKDTEELKNMIINISPFYRERK